MGTTSTVRVALNGAGYDILIGDGLLTELPTLLARYCHAARYAVITDSTVAPLYGERLLARLSEVAPCTLCTFPAGEWNKSRESWSDLTDKLLAAGIGRDGAIVALGGGVAGDLAGFVAATYLRGIPYVQVPTSLLAMIDSSIGGKTGVDTPLGKNLVGAFHQPRAVFADVAALATLPKPHVAAGVAEALKHGAIADADYFARTVQARDRLLARDPAALHDLIQRSVALKGQIVSADEREQGKRAMLNFGHTIGHALEATSGYQLLHGEAVALGMVLEARLGVALGVTEAGAVSQLEEALQAFNLPLERPADASAERVIAAMSSDKKARGGAVRFALISRIGAIAQNGQDWTHPVPESSLAKVLAG